MIHIVNHTQVIVQNPASLLLELTEDKEEGGGGSVGGEKEGKKKRIEQSKYIRKTRSRMFQSS